MSALLTGDMEGLDGFFGGLMAMVVVVMVLVIVVEGHSL